MKRRDFLITTTAASASLVAGPGRAAGHDYDQLDVTAGGQVYRLFRAIPAAPKRALYVLDGNAAKEVLTPERLSAHPDLAVIAVGYPTDQRFDQRRRALDYTPPVAQGVDPRRPSGGAPAFLSRLTGPIRARAEQGLQIRHRILAGHSYGGLFTCWALLTAPGSFDAYASVSASLWYGDGLLPRLLPGAPLPRPTRLVYAYSDTELRRGQKMSLEQELANRRAFTDALAARPGLSVSTRVLHGLHHGQTMAAGLPLALSL